MAGRPLLISDCDEVILHFASHFAEWVDEAADLSFALDAPGFAGALRSRDGRIVPEERVWPLLDLFWTMLILFLWTFALWFHFCAGIRHLVWDLGYALELPQVYLGGWIVVGASIGLRSWPAFGT